MNNFYTATVYEKGAEVVRLYQTLFGKEGFRKGLRHYLQRHDGAAVTCDDFRAAMAEANDADLAQLERWYSQPGTPAVRASGLWDEAAGTYALTLEQSLREVPDHPPPRPLPIPVRVGLLAANGRELPGSDRTLLLTEARQTFTFDGVESRPVASIGRGFSAPVRFEVERSQEELAFLLANDTDAFNRWEAGQELSKRVILGLVADVGAKRPLEVDPMLVDALREVLLDPGLDGSMKSLTLALPSEELISQDLTSVDPDAVYRARQHVVRELGSALRPEWERAYREHAKGTDEIDKAQVNRRRIKNRALRYLVSLEEPETIALAADQFRSATGMTDYEAAFASLVDLVSEETDEAILAFYARWRSEPLVLDKWFRMQAMSRAPNAFERVVALAEHPDFTLANPNRARSLLYAFAAGNPTGFHRADGAAYRFVADRVLELDGINPQVASRLVSTFNQWKRYEPSRSGKMKAALERIASHSGISKDVGEIVERALER
jgi:aminopeptidase N